MKLRMNFNSDPYFLFDLKSEIKMKSFEAVSQVILLLFLNTFFVKEGTNYSFKIKMIHSIAFTFFP
jgi:hypothetical protein